MFINISTRHSNSARRRRIRGGGGLAKFSNTGRLAQSAAAALAVIKSTTVEWAELVDMPKGI